MGYPKERKEAVLKKMMPPHNKPIPELADEEGISIGTLYNWRNQARRNGQLLPDADLSPEGWSSQDKFAAVLETATLNEAELAEYCRKRGLYPEQIQTWKQACIDANNWQQAAGPLVLSLVLALVQLGTISFIRFSLTGTMTGFPGL